MKEGTPGYYKSSDSNLDVIDIIKIFNLNFNMGNVFKYIARSGKKTFDGIQDLEKAKDYIEREIKYLKGETTIEEEEKPKGVIVIPFKLKLGQIEIKELQADTRIKMRAHPELREGQALMSVLHIVHPELYRIVHNTSFDCFYVDSKMQYLLKLIKKNG